MPRVTLTSKIRHSLIVFLFATACLPRKSVQPGHDTRQPEHGEVLPQIPQLRLTSLDPSLSISEQEIALSEVGEVAANFQIPAEALDDRQMLQLQDAVDAAGFVTLVVAAPNSNDSLALGNFFAKVTEKVGGMKKGLHPSMYPKGIAQSMPSAGSAGGALDQDALRSVLKQGDDQTLDRNIYRKEDDSTQEGLQVFVKSPRGGLREVSLPRLKLPDNLASKLVVKSSVAENSIPDLTHFVWFGRAPDQDVFANINRIAKLSKDKPVVVWYSENQLRSDGALAEVLATFNSKLQEKNIVLASIDAIPRERLLRDDQVIFDRAMTRIHEEISLSKSYSYMRNYAAGSDIARVLLLKHFGGVYLDGDSPLVRSTANLKSPHGFMFDMRPDPSGNLVVSNARLASAPKGKFISGFLDEILDNYDRLRVNRTGASFHSGETLASFRQDRDSLFRLLKEITLRSERFESISNGKVIANDPVLVAEQKQMKELEREYKSALKSFQDTYPETDDLIFAHRANNVAGLLGRSPRFQSTLDVSGPKALSKYISEQADDAKGIGEARLKERYGLPDGLLEGEGAFKASWFDNN